MYKKVAPPLLVEESLMEIDPPSTSLYTCDLSSGDEDDCDGVYTCYSTTTVVMNGMIVMKMMNKCFVRVFFL